MPPRFEMATAGRILFGAGTVREVAAAVAGHGKRPLLVTGRTGLDRARSALEGLKEATHFQVPGEPDTEVVQTGLILARSEGCDVVLGFGGGSVLDAAKAVAALLPHDTDLLAHLEVVGQGLPVPGPGVPFVAVPTTAGAGAEVTRNAVLASPAHRVKASLRSPYLLARLAVVDPELTLSLPPTLTASTGMDALTQLIEPWVSNRANPFTDSVCLEGISRAARSLPRAFQTGQDLHARGEMALASLFGGLALANAGLGAVHGFAAPLGGMFPAPHGAVCAALLPHVMRMNIEALRSRQPESPILERYREVARRLTGRDSANVQEGIDWVSNLAQSLQIPKLRAYGINQADLPTLSENAAVASSMKANPILLSPEERLEILQAAW